MSTDLTQPSLERPATRADLARQLLGRVERLPDQFGTVPLATEVQLLKRDLSRGHDLLRASGEASFLSVVTLVESALACLTWKQYTHEVVGALRQAFAAGARQTPFTFADYDVIRRLFAERGVPTVPTVDLGSLGPKISKMTKKVDRCYLLDTSAVIYHRHGHTLQRSAVEEAVADGIVEVPVFVRMEYLRGVIINLIDMHSLLKESVTVEDALIDWSQQVRQERKLKVVLLTVSRWLVAQDNWPSKDRSLQRLGDFIVRLIWSFDEAYSQPPSDPLACVLGRVAIAKQNFEDERLLDFYERFQAIRQGVPACGLCRFRQAQRRRLRRREIDLIGPEARVRHAGNPGFLRQADVLAEAEVTRDRAPGCRWCERLGDSLIALLAKRGVRIVTADRTFAALGELLGAPVVLLPSLAELKRRASLPAEAPGEPRPQAEGPNEVR